MWKKIICIVFCAVLVSIVLPEVGSLENNMTSQLMSANNIESCLLGNFNWYETQKILASDGAADNNFGISVSIDGDYAVVGSVGDDSGLGSAYVLKYAGTSWMQEAKLIASDGVTGDGFGYSVSIDGDYAAIGTPFDISSTSMTGSAYIFKRTGTIWLQESKLSASDGANGDYFGWSISISGDYAIVGAPGDNFFQGSSYIFKRIGTTWSQEAKLLASDGAAGEYFGNTVCISNEYAIIGANADNSNQGSAYIFKRTGNVWLQEAKLVASDGVASDNFGYSVSIYGDYAAIGATGDDSGRGSAYIFKRTGTIWLQEAKLIASDGAANDYLGVSISICGNYACIGTKWGDGVVANCGSAYVFKRTSTTWLQDSKLIASDGATSDNFGYSVSISGYNVLVGAYLDDNTYGTDAGSAYVYKKPVPDLDCNGVLTWTDVKAGDTVAGEFALANIGEPTSQLSWAIESYPDWGSWSFTPSSGSGLVPEIGAITISVVVTAPKEVNKEFTGEIKIVNSELGTDYDIISVSLTTPVIRNLCLQNLYDRLSECFPNAFTILKHLIWL